MRRVYLMNNNNNNNNNGANKAAHICRELLN